MKLIVTGSIAYDYLMTFPGKFKDQILPDKLDHISLSFLVDKMVKQQGGTAANIAYSLALLGERPLLLGAVGKDFAPYREFLKRAGVDTHTAVEFPESFTASFFANTDQEGNQICSFYTGSMRFASRVSLESAGASSADWVIISPNDPEAMLMLADECRTKNIPFISDPGQQIARFDKEDLIRMTKNAKILIMNEYENDLFMNRTQLSQAGWRTLAETLIVTLGEKGAQIYTKDKEIRIPSAKPEKILDPTGVGDAFRAGLMKGLVHQLSWETAGRMGCLAAAYVLETEGPQNHCYNIEEFVRRYQSVYQDSGEITGWIRSQ